ncbi:MAG: hypothetical protein R6X15_11795 [Pseudomonadota bacterium]
MEQSLVTDEPLQPCRFTLQPGRQQYQQDTGIEQELAGVGLDGISPEVAAQRRCG